MRTACANAESFAGNCPCFPSIDNIKYTREISLIVTETVKTAYSEADYLLQYTDMDKLKEKIKETKKLVDNAEDQAFDTQESAELMRVSCY